MSADLNAIKARWAAATPGPWAVFDDCPQYVMKPDKPGSDWDGTIVAELPRDEFDLVDHPTAEAIAHAPEDIAALIQALEEVREALDSHEMRYEYRNAERDAVANIRTVLERRMGADWLNGRGEPEMLGGAPNIKHHDATFPTDGEQPGPDWRPLSEDVSGHTMGPARSHADGRICMYHHRLDAWTWDFVSECLRDHEDPRC